MLWELTEVSSAPIAGTEKNKKKIRKRYKKRTVDNRGSFLYTFVEQSIKTLIQISVCAGQGADGRENDNSRCAGAKQQKLR